MKFPPKGGKKHTILLIDDEESIRLILKDILEGAGYIVEEALSGEKGIEKINEKEYSVVISDLKMQGMSGIEVLEESRKIRPNVPVIILTAYGTIETAVKATKMGAYDFLVKPPDIHHLLLSIRNAINYKEAIEEKDFYRSKLEGEPLPGAPQLIGNTPQIIKIKEIIEKVAPTDAKVLITGPTGSGKDLIARLIHIKSRRTKYPFLAVNCAAIPPELIESELFGHEKGAFTSAYRSKRGKFELANNGTLFLDEIGDMSLAAQAKVLRTIETGELTPVGAEKSIKVNVRIIAATNKNLENEIKLGKFREDLYHRINVVNIQVPPLKERREDIPLLIDHFTKIFAQQYGIPIKKFTDDALKALTEKEWPGNVRELQNIVEKVFVLLDSVTIVSSKHLEDIQVL